MANILGVRVNNLVKQEIFQKIETFLNDGKFHQVATVNPEFILEAKKNAEFKNILNSCDLNVADGFGIKCAFFWLGEKLKYRLTGIDLMMDILKIAREKNLSIFLVANKNGLSSWEETAQAINKIYPSLKISGADMQCHSECSPDNRDEIEESNYDNDRSLNYVRDGKYNIVFANFGAPFQEKFLHSLKNEKNDKIRLVMGVGGSFDYLTGKVKRAPKFLRKIGFEWLWRLIQQPKRIKRIWNAVVVFPLRVMIR